MLLSPWFIYVETNINQELTDYTGSVRTRMDWYLTCSYQLLVAFHF